jgi:hypothetical protein
VSALQFVHRFSHLSGRILDAVALYATQSKLFEKTAS